MYTGSCHCGAVQFTTTVSLDQPITCNCSICKRSGTILVFTGNDHFTLTSGSENLRSYLFGKKHIDHLFCSVCGIKSFAKGKDAEGNDVYAVNVRCLEGVDLSTLTPTEYNGAAL